MRAGDLDRRITVQSYAYVEDEYGSGTEVYTDVGTFAASFHQESGREFFAQAGIQTESKVMFRLRWIGGVTVLYRVVYDGRTYNIHEVKELGRREGLELHASTQDI